jgi:hypothetical protein
LDISFSFLTPSLLAFRGINQQEDQQKDRKKNTLGMTIKTGKKRQDKNNSSKKKGYTAANGYFGFNAVAQLGPGIQK